MMAWAWPWNVNGGAVRVQGYTGDVRDSRCGWVGEDGPRASCGACCAWRCGRTPRHVRSPRKGKSQSSICCNSCCSNYKVNKKGVVSSVKGVRKGKLTAELAVTARKAIEMRQKAEEAKEVVLVSDSDSDAA